MATKRIVKAHLRRSTRIQDQSALVSAKKKSTSKKASLRRSARIKLHHTALANTKNQESCRLLALPAELRVAIYEYTLTEDDKIVNMTPRLRLPGLLSTCRQVRAETISIWFSEVNSFGFGIQDCDAGVMRKFWRRLKLLPQANGMPYFIGLKGSKDWASVMEWCHDVWEQTAGHLPPQGEAPGDLMPPQGEEYNEFSAVVAGARDLARLHRGKTWKECEKALLTLRKVVGIFEPAWLD